MYYECMRRSLFFVLSLDFTALHLILHANFIIIVRLLLMRLLYIIIIIKYIFIIYVYFFFRKLVIAKILSLMIEVNSLFNFIEISIRHLIRKLNVN